MQVAPTNPVVMTNFPLGYRTNILGRLISALAFAFLLFSAKTVFSAEANQNLQDVFFGIVESLPSQDSNKSYVLTNLPCSVLPTTLDGSQKNVRLVDLTLGSKSLDKDLFALRSIVRLAAIDSYGEITYATVTPIANCDRNLQLDAPLNLIKLGLVKDFLYSNPILAFDSIILLRYPYPIKFDPLDIVDSKPYLISSIEENGPWGNWKGSTSGKEIILQSQRGKIRSVTVRKGVKNVTDWIPIPISQPIPVYGHASTDGTTLIWWLGGTWCPDGRKLALTKLNKVDSFEVIKILTYKNTCFDGR